MAATSGVYRTTFKDSAGKVHTATTWIASYFDPTYRDPKTGRMGKHRKKGGFPSAKAAQQFRAEMSASGGPLSSTLTLRELCALVETRYIVAGQSSLPHLKRREEYLFDSFGADTLARTITEDSVTSHIMRMRQEGYSPATIQRSLALLKTGFRIAHRKLGGHAIAIPFIPKMDESGNVRQGFFDPEQLEQILAHLPLEARAAVRFIHATGWRSAEIVMRQWSDIKDGVLYLPRDKGKKPRGFPLGSLATIIEGLPKTGPFIFHNSLRDGKPTCPKWWLRGHWDRARVKAGFPKAILHDFRRTAARDLIRAGVDQSSAMKVLGHLTDSMFRRYQIVEAEDVARAAKALEEYRNNLAPKDPPKPQRKASSLRLVKS